MKMHFLLILLVAVSGYSQVGIGTTTPNGALDINSSTNGIVVPNVVLTSRGTSAPVVNPNGGGIPLNGTLVWNTATAGTSPNNVVPGFYFWDTTAWVAVAGDGGKNWTISGNGGTTAGTNFIGTTDAVDFRLKTGGNDRWNISNTNTGQLQSYSLGTASLPIYSFQSNTNTGFFSSSVNNLDFSTNGTARIRIPNANQIHALSLGTAALPFYSFSADTGIGMWSPATSTLSFSTTGVERMRMLSDGRIVTNNITAGAADQFSTYSASDAISGYSTSNGIAIYGSSATSGGVGVYGITSGTTSTTVPIYGYNNATNSGTAFTYASVVASIFGDASKSGNYKFGAYGYGGTSKRSGGIMGNCFDTTFGGLGYFSNGSINYSLYGFGTAANTGGATGRMVSENLERNNQIGLGVYGGVMGGWVRGLKYGFHTKGETYSLYIDGNGYTNKPFTLLTDTPNEKVATFMTTAIKPEVSCNGKSTLSNGKAYIQFDSNFSKVISNVEDIILNVTPQGNSKGIYVSEITKEGFWVYENNNGNSSVKIFWSANATIKDDDRHDIPSDLLSKDFDQKMDGVMSNDYYINNNPQSLWWDGSKIRWDKYQEDRAPITEPKVKPKTVNSSTETNTKK